jgi:hypothetical protein
MPVSLCCAQVRCVTFSRTLSESRSGFNEASFHLSLQGEMPHS